MVDISIQETTFERLQRHARPLLDTTDSVVNRALDALERLEGVSAATVGRTEPERRIDPRRLPDLKHTKVLDAEIEGVTIPKPHWNLLLDTILIEAMRQVSDFSKLRQLCPVNMVQQRKEDEGYKYLGEIGISVQGQDANAACRAVLTTAQALGLGVEIGFMWRPKDGAAHPGERARLVIPTSSGAINRTRAA